MFEYANRQHGSKSQFFFYKTNLRDLRDTFQFEIDVNASMSYRG